MASQTTAEATDEAREPGLWQHADFLKLWVGQSASLIGTNVTIVAVPLIAVVLLDASELQVGILGASVRLPMVLFPFAGVWIDRVRRRRVLLWSDVVRGAALATIPLLYWADLLNMVWLCAVVLVVGLFSVLFEVAYRSYLPSLVSTQHLGDANSKLQLSDSVSKAVGPGVASFMLGWWSAATVIVADVVSYVGSAVSLALIRHPEPKPEDDGERPNVLAAIWAGLHWVMAQPLIRPLALASAVYSFFEVGVLQAMFVIFALEVVDIPATWIGFIFATGGAGAIVGAFLSGRLMKSVGPGPTMLWCMIIGNTSLLLVPLAAGPRGVAAAMLVVSQVVVNMTTQIFLVNHITLIQTITPRELQGRVVGTIWSLGLVPAPLGALLGGVLGEAVGLRPTLLVSAVIGGLVPIALIFFSAVPRQRTLPDGPDGAGDGGSDGPDDPDVPSGDADGADTERDAALPDPDGADAEPNPAPEGTRT
jgi:MFS family permease